MANNIPQELRCAGEWAMPKPDLNKLLRRAADEIESLRETNAVLKRGVAVWKEQADLLKQMLQLKKS